MIRDIILIQKQELEIKRKDKYVQRIVTVSENNANLVRVIIGPRRAGKSFFGMHQLVNEQSFGFVNFDDERLLRIKNFDEILQAVLSVYNNPQVLLLDEIQNLPDWEIIVNRLQRQEYQLIITGSNSNLLSSELATHLTGRHLPIHIYTFSFAEYITSFEKELTEAEKKEKFNDFLICGGYPEPLMKSINYNEYLQVLFDSILFKDIVKRHRIRQPEMLENMAVWLISNITAEFSMNSLSKQIDISSVHTIKRYLNYLHESFVFFTINGFSYKTGKQLQSNQKVYCFDNGFYRAKANYFSDDWVKLLENLIAAELMKNQKKDGSKVYFWKGPNQEEVDFVVQKGNKIEKLIQVCWNAENAKTRKREVRALLNAWQKLKQGELIVITNNEESREMHSWFGTEKEIQFIPAWKWLLKKD
ncbi:MAG: ATP-binding protein [Bacteroidales bacterium]|nr:ATP-binding protein [Bacteroidales bacterium]